MTLCSADNPSLSRSSPMPSRQGAKTSKEILTLVQAVLNNRRGNGVGAELQIQLFGHLDAKRFREVRAVLREQLASSDRAVALLGILLQEAA